LKRAGPLSKPLLGIAALFLAATNSQDPRGLERRLFDEFETICVQTDGDAEYAGKAAIDRGYVSAQHLVPDGMFRSDRLNVYEKTDGGVTFRLTTRPSSISSSWEGAVAQNRCHLAVAGGDRGRLRGIVGSSLGLRSFRSGDAAVYAWTETDDGERRAVSRAAFEGSFIRLMETDGLRFITAARHDGLLMLGYFARNPLEQCRRRQNYRECWER
jgi:hypothetical protein